MSKDVQLNAESTLADLPLHYFQVTPATLGEAVARQFSQEVALPGVIIADDRQLLGTISRRRFNEWMSSPYGLEIFLERPIEFFLHLSQQQEKLWQLPDTTKVTEAIAYVLDRPGEDIYEPIIVISSDRTITEIPVYFLLEFQTLVRAQSEISQRVSQDIHHTRQEIKRYQVKLEQEQQKSQKFLQIINNQRGAITERQQVEGKLIEVEHKIQDLTALNQHLVSTGKIATAAGKQAFQGTFAGIDVIIGNTAQIVEIGRFLSEELNKIQTASQLIRTVSEQVHHLAVQAAIVANHSDAKLGGFSQITNEIGKMMSRTLEAGREMNRTADRFTQRLQELTTSAREGMKISRSLIKRIEQAKSAIAEMEALVEQAARDGTLPPDATLPINPSPLPDSGESLLNYPEGTQALAQKLAIAENTLADLAKLTRSLDSSVLVQKIQRTLKQKNPLTHGATTPRGKGRKNHP